MSPLLLLCACNFAPPAPQEGCTGPVNPAVETEELAQQEERRHEVGHTGDEPSELSAWLAPELARSRAALVAHGHSLEAYLTVDGSAHPSGGADPGSHAVRALFDAIWNVDAERAWGLRGTQFELALQALGGADASAQVGLVQPYSNIDAADDRVQIARVWAQQEWDELGTLVRLGKMDANGLFATVLAGAPFLHSSMGYSPTILGFPTYPDPAFGIAAHQELVTGIGAQVGLWDGEGQAGAATGERGPGTLFRGSSGLFWIGELEGTWTLATERRGRAAVGLWHHSGTFERFDGADEQGSSGTYLVLEQTLTHTWGTGTLDTFLQLGFADEEVSPITRHVGFGLVASQLLLPEREDEIALGVSYAALSDEPGAGFMTGSETALELLWGFQIAPGVRLKPDVQVVLDPGGDASLANAWILTLRVTLAL